MSVNMHAVKAENVMTQNTPPLKFIGVDTPEKVERYIAERREKALGVNLRGFIDLTNEQVKGFLQCSPNVVSLVIEGKNIDDGIVPIIAEYGKNLQKLTLRNCHLFSYDAYKDLSQRISGLRFSFQNCHLISDEHINRLPFYPPVLIEC